MLIWSEGFYFQDSIMNNCQMDFKNGDEFRYPFLFWSRNADFEANCEDKNCATRTRTSVTNNKQKIKHSALRII